MPPRQRQRRRRHVTTTTTTTYATTMTRTCTRDPPQVRTRAIPYMALMLLFQRPQRQRHFPRAHDGPPR